MFKRLFLPGIVFQSVVIAGGYGTGREIVEFFLSLGPGRGFVAMIAAMVIWSIVCCATFDFARVFATYDYRSLVKKLIGKGWVVFEICYFIFMMLVLGVVAAASGAVFQDTFQLPYYAGVGIALLAIVAIAIGGNKLVEKTLGFWAMAIYAIYAYVLFLSFNKFGAPPLPADSLPNDAASWGTSLLGGVIYAGYNLAVIPAVLFTIRFQKSRSDSIISGILAGIIGMLPAIMIYFAMLSHYPAIVSEQVPTNYILKVLDSVELLYVFQIILFGTLIDTGVGLIHAVNERVNYHLQERGLTLSLTNRGLLSALAIVIGALVSSFGLVDLIAKGYGALTWAFIVVFVVPILTIGIYKIGWQSKVA